MLLTEADVARLAGLGHDPAAFAETRDGWRVLRNRPWPGDPAGEERACVFLDAEGRCTVHADRPAGCRLYPLVFDLEEGPYLDDGTCPFTEAFAPRVGAAERAGLERLKAVLTQERRRRQINDTTRG